jgi:NitT/TauT family transport system ATP-binding protein
MLADRIGVMSARPGHFVEMVATRWHRTRDSRIISDPRFGDITSRLWNRLREESLRAMGRAATSSAAD